MTVVIGSAFDIVTAAGTPRYVYNDMPLGNPLGIPGDRDAQRQTVELALDLAIDANQAGAVVETSQRFAADESWKQQFMKITEENRALLLQMGDENRANRRRNRELGLVRK